MTATSTGLMSNWKNVNNWHWVEKNCTSWSVEYLNEAFKSIIASNKDIKVKIERVDNIEGDVDVNQRKGRVLYFYDLKIKCHWKAETLDETFKASGLLTIPEFSNEISSANDLSFHVEINEEENKHSIFRSTIPSLVREHVFRVLKQFHHELERVHGPSVIVPDSQDAMKAQDGPASPAVVKTTKAETVKTADPQSRYHESVSTSSLKQTIEFYASSQDLYNVLTDADAIALWSRNAVRKDAKSGLHSIFDGNVQFVFTKLELNKKIEMKWRLTNWPDDQYSLVTITLAPGDGYTALTLAQQGIPANDYERTEANWREYYWNSIKRIYGFGPVF